MAQCNECQTTDEDLYYYWQGDIEEDYDLGNNDCLCENCFSKIPTKFQLAEATANMRNRIRDIVIYIDIRAKINDMFFFVCRNCFCVRFYGPFFRGNFRKNGQNFGYFQKSMTFICSWG